MDDYSETKGEEKDDSSRSSRKYRFKIIQTACVYAAYISLVSEYFNSLNTYLLTYLHNRHICFYVYI